MANTSLELPTPIAYVHTRVDWGATLEGIPVGENRTAELTLSQANLFYAAARKLRKTGASYKFRKVLNNIYIISRLA